MSFKELPLMSEKNKGTVMFYPYVSKKSGNNIKKYIINILNVLIF